MGGVRLIGCLGEGRMFVCLGEKSRRLVALHLCGVMEWSVGWWRV